LLAGVYYLLVTILRGKHEPVLFAHLTLGLFAFNLIATAASTGATSVTSSGKLLINTAFPRLLIPLAAVRTAVFRFLPTVPVYLIFHIILLPTVWSPVQLLSLYFLGTMVVFSMGLAAFFAALQVYFRDTASFLPYFIRIWMYLSPVLWLPESIAHMSKLVTTIIELNPVYSMLGAYALLIQETTIPPLYMWVTAAGWAFGSAVVGFLFFISREREFAVRLT
jgi:ABC-type polysaccharide/polyol phosphate export permease